MQRFTQLARRAAPLATRAVVSRASAALRRPSRLSSTTTVLGDSATTSATKADGVQVALRSVCKIYVTIVEPDYAQPWSNFAEDEAVGSGFIVEDHDGVLRVLTNSHVTRWGTDLRVRRHGETKRHKARLIGVAHESDLALLAVDADFWQQADAGTQPIRPLKWASLPNLYDDVAVIGYPMGGDNVCVTRGVVSRVDTMKYARAAPALLVVQIDAAVNSGNSGGPAIDAGGRVVGVAFSGYAGSADNIGYIIPHSVASNFLSSVSKQRREDAACVSAPQDYVAHVELCTLGISAQPAENDALRASLGMDTTQTGVLVTRVAELSCARGTIRTGDVLLSIDGVAIADDGTVALRGDERVDLAHACTSRLENDVVVVKVLREGKVLENNVELKPLPRLVPIVERDRQPSYLIIGGLVLMPLTLPLLTADMDGDEGAPSTRTSVMHTSSLGADRSDAAGAPTELVVWASTLTSDANIGYASLCRDLPLLKTVNGVSVRSIQHVLDICAEARGRGDAFLEFSFGRPNAAAHDLFRVVLDVDAAQKADLEIMSKRFVPALFSPDVRPPATAFTGRQRRAALAALEAGAKAERPAGGRTAKARATNRRAASKRGPRGAVKPKKSPPAAAEPAAEPAAAAQQE
ncbi:trypsin-like cysteine/serine peptidase domain-containing protein [Pelagophyceae sp. CCMP2097]|nr:trypsin-like cysteine/serine peptidase domain-containing protein [Pelagophyceae sp. CCMP2097]